MRNFIVQVICLFLLSFATLLSAQNKFTAPAKPLGKKIDQINPIQNDNLYRPIIDQRSHLKFDFHRLKQIPALRNFEVKRNGTSIWLKGDLPNGSARKKPNDPSAYLEAVAHTIGNSGSMHSYRGIQKSIDNMGMTHHKMQQLYNGIPVFLGELILHEKEGSINSLNGQVLAFENEPAPAILKEEDALIVARAQVQKPHLSQHPSHRDLAPETSELVVFVDKKNQAHYAWHINVIPNLHENWEMIIDASSGELLNIWSNVCRISGHHHEFDYSCEMENAKDYVAPPIIGSGTDLNGQAQELRLFEQDGTFFMFDDSRDMFESYGDEQTAPAGAIITFEMQDDESSPIATSNSAAVGRSESCFCACQWWYSLRIL